MADSAWKTSLEKAVDFRIEKNYFSGSHDNAFRLFNGYTEKLPELVIDIYAKTAVINDLSESCSIQNDILEELIEYLRFRLPFLKTVILKQRYALSATERNG